jgi:hypothetical protein
MADDKQICTAEEEGKVERQGGSFSLLGLFSLFTLIGLRRRLSK